MNIKENIRIAVFSIRTNLLRSLLTMLGIIIGVSSVISIVTVGNGGRDYIVGMIREMGNSARLTPKPLQMMTILQMPMLMLLRSLMVFNMHQCRQWLCAR